MDSSWTQPAAGRPAHQADIVHKACYSTPASRHELEKNVHSMADRACYNCGETGTPPSPSLRSSPCILLAPLLPR